MIAYGLMTYLSPGEWPFWLAAGIMWELFECYTMCWSKYKFGCSGVYDIITNLAGIAVAMWILHIDYK
jgi:hypothetical protein